MSGTAGPTNLRKKPSFPKQKGALQNARPGQFQKLVWRRTPIIRPAPGIESLEALSLLGLGRSRFRTEGGGVIAALDGFAIAQFAGNVPSLGLVFTAEKDGYAS
jgi:hypothetical protein